MGLARTVTRHSFAVKYILDNIQNVAIPEISFTQTKHLGIEVPETTEKYKR